MIRSMTGFGKAAGQHEGQEIAVELSAVNHRYFDVALRLPNTWLALEGDVKQLLRERISRGKITGTVSRKRLTGPGQAVRFDPETAKQYIEASRQLAKLLNSNETLSVNVLAQLEGVFVPQEPEEDIEATKGLLLAVVREAADRLNAMRALEGRSLAEDIRSRIESVRRTLASIETRLPELNAEYEKRLRARVEELKGELSFTEERISMEVAFLADKADVTEEVVRLKAHLEHMAALLEQDEPVGRRLDFLAQEVQREANTLGVKTRDSDATKDVLHIKAEVEKIREQVQNIE